MGAETSQERKELFWFPINVHRRYIQQEIIEYVKLEQTLLKEKTN